MSLSTMRLERRACTIPIPVLRSTTPRKVRFFQAPVKMTSAARMILIRLNRVQVFSMTSSLTDLVLSSVLTLTLPCATRSATSDDVKPRVPNSTATRSSGDAPLLAIPITDPFRSARCLVTRKATCETARDP